MSDKDKVEQQGTDRTKRDHETREAEAKPLQWVQPNVLPTPDNEPGYRFRWIRSAIMGQPDMKNVSLRFREGWVPVKAEDHPELHLIPDAESKWGSQGLMEVGGLLLCKIPEEIVRQRNAHFAQMADAQMTAIDNSWMKEEDSRMPLLRPERSTKVSFGGGGK